MAIKNQEIGLKHFHSITKRTINKYLFNSNLYWVYFNIALEGVVNKYKILPGRPRGCPRARLS